MWSVNQQSTDNVLENYLRRQDELLNEIYLILYSDEVVEPKYLKCDKVDYINELKTKIKEWITDVDSRWYFIKVNTPGTISADTTTNTDTLDFTIDLVHGFVLNNPDSLEYIVRYEIYDDNDYKIYENEIKQTSNSFSIVLPNVHTLYGGYIKIYAKIYNKDFDIYSPEIEKIVNVISTNTYPNDTITITSDFNGLDPLTEPIRFEITGFQEMFPELNLIDVYTTKKYLDFEWKIIERQVDKIVVELVFTYIGYRYLSIPLYFVLADTNGSTTVYYELGTSLNTYDSEGYTGIRSYSSTSSSVTILDSNTSLSLAPEIKRQYLNGNLIYDGYNTQVYIQPGSNEIGFMIDNYYTSFTLPKTFPLGTCVKILDVYNNGLYLIYKQSPYSFMIVSQSGRYKEIVLPNSTDIHLTNATIRNGYLYLSLVDNSVPQMFKMDLGSFSILEQFTGYADHIIDVTRMKMYSREDIYDIQELGNNTFNVQFLSKLPIYFYSRIIDMFGDILFGDAVNGDYLAYKLDENFQTNHQIELGILDRTVHNILYKEDTISTEYIIHIDNSIYRTVTSRTYEGNVHLDINTYLIISHYVV